MNITINGEAQVVEGTDITLAFLLEHQNVATPDMVTVQVNGAFVDKSEYGSRRLQENDEVDFLYFMGGGRPCPAFPR